MTDGERETADTSTGTGNCYPQASQDSQSSTGSMSDYLLQKLDEVEYNQPTLEMSDSDVALILGLNRDGTVCVTGTGVQPSEENTGNSPIKSEPQQGETSPDSGYQPPSNDSRRSIGDEATGRPVLAPRQEAYEIEPQPISINPPRSNYPGEYNFQIGFEKRDSVPKNINHTHSNKLNKWFVKMETACPVYFHCSRPPPKGAVIRGMLLYHNQEHVHETVGRCHNHKGKDSSDKEKHELADHVLQAFVPPNCPYQCYPSYDTARGRFSVIVPYIPPAVGVNYFVSQYKFMCLSTCVGGINRRRMLAVFTLEDSVGSTLGRACIEVKVSASPGRDRPKEEEKLRRSSEPCTLQIAQPKKRTAAESHSTQGFKFLKVKEKHFGLLSQLNDALNLADMATDEQRAEYNEEEQKHKWLEELLNSIAQTNSK